jgi:hypothetical protein
MTFLKVKNRWTSTPVAGMKLRAMFLLADSDDPDRDLGERSSDLTYVAWLGHLSLDG